MDKMKQPSGMMRHYLAIKEQYKDCLLFYRLGDFYEMFYDDAIIASDVLGLTLTGKNCGLDERAPMCGVPHHSVDTYIAKLVNEGYKIALCEQLTSPNGRELIERDVVRIITAGTLIEDNLIDDNKNNYIACCYKNASEWSVAWSDITTGEFYTQYFDGEDAFKDICDFLTKISPAEIVGNAEFGVCLNDTALVVHRYLPRVNILDDARFSVIDARETLKIHFSVENLIAFNIENNDCVISACGALISYFNETQKKTLQVISDIKLETNSEYMSLDSSAIRNLELVKSMRDNKPYGSLFWLLNKTKTSMGARLLQNWILKPLVDKEKINKRLDGVECFYKNTMLCQNLSDTLKSVKDVARLTGKISNDNLTPKDCLALKCSLSTVPSIKMQLMGINVDIVNQIDRSLFDFNEVVNLLDSAIDDEAPASIKDGKVIKSGYCAELDELREYSKNSKKILDELEARERVETGIKNLRVGYNRVFGYYIEVTNSFKEQVPYSYIRKQTLTNAERYVTEELKELEEKILTSEEKAFKLESQLYADIKRSLLSYVEQFKELSDAIAVLDILVAFALVAKKNDYVKPQMLSSGEKMEILAGRHPVVENISKEQFVPNDTVLDADENKMMIITGPNMAGKSTYLRQVALITVMAQIGAFVPAKVAKIPICDKVFTRVGASDNLIFNQSTFMVEMTEVASILHSCTKNSLIILDEIGRGTSTYDGLSIAWAVVEYIFENIGAKTLFATHYHELTELETKFKGVKNYKITVKEFNNSIIFLRKIMRGGANKSFGIEVALLAGVPAPVITRAKAILSKLEKSNINHAKASGESPKAELSQVELILKDLQIDNLSPIQALNVLVDLKEKVEKENN